MENKTEKSRLFPGYLQVPVAVLSAMVSGGTTTLSYFVISIMVKEGLIDSTVSGTCVSLVAVASILFSAMVGVMYKKIGHKKSMIVGFTVPIISFIILATLPVSNMLCIACALLWGFCLVVVSKIGTPSLIRTWFDKRASLPMALIIAAASMSSFLTTPMGKIMTETSYKSGWIFIAALCVLAIIVVLLFVRDDVKEIGEVPDSVAWRKAHGLPLEVEKKEVAGQEDKGAIKKVIFKNPKFWLFSICSLFRMGVYAGSNAYITLIILSRGISAEQAGIALASLTLSSTVGRLATPAIIKVLRLSNSQSNALAHVITFLGCMLLVFGQSLAVFSFAVMCIGFSYGLGFVSQTLTIGNLFPDIDFSTVLGFFNTVIGFNFVFPILVGYVGKMLGENYLPIYLVLGLINIAAAIILLVFARDKKKAEPVQA